MTPERKRALVQAAGFSAFGFVVFVVSFAFAFPYDRIKDQVIAMAGTQNLDVTVEEAGPVFGVGVALDDVKVSTRVEPGKKPSRLVIEKASVHVSPLAQLRGEAAYDLDLRTMQGEVDVGLRVDKTAGTTKITTRKIAMSELPGVKEAINLTLGGNLDLDVEIVAPGNRNAEANGNLSWKWAEMAVGDGKEKLKIAGNPLLAEGISLPRVRLGDFAGKVVFQKGTGRLQGVGARSPDAEVRIEGEVRLSDPLAYTHLDLYVMFKFSDAMLKSADKLQVMLQFAEAMGKRPDGFFGFRVTGTPGQFGPVQWTKTSPFNSGPGGRASLDDRPARPRPGFAPSPGAPSGTTTALERSPAPPPAPEAVAPVVAEVAAQASAAAQMEKVPAAEPPPPGGLPANANMPKYVTSPPRE